jgi:hypothetical protein
VVRIHGIANTAEAQVDHLRAAVDCPADRPGLRVERNGAVRANDLRDEQPGRERQTGDALCIVHPRRDQAGDESPVSLRVLVRRAADEGVGSSDPATAKLGMLSVDP